jgi:hypothetical protein
MKTSVEISPVVMRDAQRIVKSEGTTLRALIDEGLRLVVQQRAAQDHKFVLRDCSVPGRGLNAEFGSGWEAIRDAIYDRNSG